MLSQEALQQALQEQFHQFKSKNPSYSIRAYAQRLKIGSGALSGIMNGKRRISAKYCSTLVERMGLAPEAATQINALMTVETKTSLGNEDQKNRLVLKSDQFHTIADGIHFALLCLMETASFRSDIDWIAHELDESAVRVRQALERLTRLELINFDGSEWTLTQIKLSTTDGIPDAAIRRFHEERLEEAKLRIHDTAIEDRDLFATTLAISRSQIPAARKLTREYKAKMARLLSTGRKDAVYRLCFQLFPVSRIDKTEKR